MKANVIHFALLMFVFVSVGCAESDNENDDIQSFSSYVRDVFDESENEEAKSVVEGEDFEFSDADVLETYSDLLQGPG